jgi:hypothetical protein
MRPRGRETARPRKVRRAGQIEQRVRNCFAEHWRSAPDAEFMIGCQAGHFGTAVQTLEGLHGGIRCK